MRKMHVWLSNPTPTASCVTSSCCGAAGGWPAKTREEQVVISLKTISEKLTAWRRYRAAMRELSQLSDHDLSDIGIGRGDIEYVARRPVVGKPSA
jgi:uncharacterized protein YjiS (DUF1127 family)